MGTAFRDTVVGLGVVAGSDAGLSFLFYCVGGVAVCDSSGGGDSGGGMVGAAARAVGCS